MPAGQFYPGQKLVEESVVQDNLFTYTTGLASKTVNPAAPAFNGSGTAVTNTFGYNVNVYLYGGSVTAVAVNGGTVAQGFAPGPVNVSLMLKPGDTITPSYTGSPTWVWQAE